MEVSYHYNMEGVASLICTSAASVGPAPAVLVLLDVAVCLSVEETLAELGVLIELVAFAFPLNF